MIKEHNLPGGEFIVKEHGGITPQDVPPRFYIQHFCPYEFIRPYIKDKKALEIGFGDGYGSFYLSKFAKNIVAVDLFQKNVDSANQKYKKDNLIFRQADAINLEFASQEFDVVYSFQVIEHIKRTEHTKFLTNIKKVLKAGGTAFISTLNRRHNIKNEKRYEKSPHHDKEFDYLELKELLLSVFGDAQIWGLFMTPRHILYQRLKKIGLNKFLPYRLNIVNRFYNNIKASDFTYRTFNLSKAIDFLAACRT